MKRTLPWLFILFTSYYLEAQVSANVTVTDITCPNNGEMLVEPKGGDNGTYTVQLTSCPTSDMACDSHGPVAVNLNDTDPNNDEVTFSSLYPGVYTLYIRDGDGMEYTEDVTIGGTYKDLFFDPEVVNQQCPGQDDGSVSVTDVSGGFGEITYTLEDNAGNVLESNNTGDFSGLAVGSYTIVGRDECNLGQEQDFTIQSSELSPVNLNTSVNIVEKTSCSDADYFSSATGGRPPYTYELLNPPTGYTGPTTQDNGTFNLPLSGAPYNFRVTDACGQTDDLTIQNRTPGLFVDFSNDCDGIDFTNYDAQFLYNAGGINIINAPASYTGPTENVTFPIENAPYGSYTFEVVDECGTSVRRTLNRTIEGLQIDERIGSLPSYCFEGFARQSILLRSGQRGTSPYTYELLNPPADYPNPTTVMSTSIVHEFDDLPEGEYNFRVTDDCGQVAERTFNVTNVLNYNYTVTPQPGCNDNSIKAMFSSNNSNINNKSYELYNSSGTLEETRADGMFSNLEGGTYTVRYQMGGTTSCAVEETVTFADEPVPQLTVARGFSCGDGTVAIVGFAEGGAEPYQYNVRNDDTGVETGYQSSPNFENLPIGDYTMFLKNACETIVSKQVSVVAGGLGLTNQGEDCADPNTDFPFYLRNFAGMTYEWRDPSGNIVSTQADPRQDIGIVNEDDYGEYTVNAQFLDCRAQTSTFDLQSCSADVTPVELAYFDAQTVGDKTIVAEWITASEVNVSHFIIEVSSNGIDFEELKSVSATGNSSTNTHYKIEETVRNNDANRVFVRLKSIDLDGTYEFSRIVTLTFESGEFQVLYPNPVRRGENIYLTSESGFLSYTIYNHLGQVMESEVMDAKETLIEINTVRLAPGTFYIRFGNGKASSFLVH